MVKKYSVDTPAGAVKARGSDLRVHFKNTREAAQALYGRSLKNAQRYLEDVLAHKQAVPFRRFTGKIGRHAQAHMYKNAVQVGWPKKSCEFLLDLVKNAQSNAEVKGEDISQLIINHIQVQRAQKQRRRTYRAHGRIGPYMASPCHIEIVTKKLEAPVPKPKAEGDKPKKKVSKKKQARERLRAGAQA